MAAAARRTVITGMSVLTPIGQAVEPFFAALCDRTTGIRRLQFVDPSALYCQIAGELQNYKPNDFIEGKEQRKAIKMMSRTVHMGLCAATAAFKDAGLAVGKIDPDRAGVEFGSGMVASELDDLGAAARESMVGPEGPVSLAAWGERGMHKIPPLWMLKYLPNMPSCHASINLDLRGPSNTITQSDSASLMALGEAHRIIQRDVADVFVVGGTESKMNPLSQTRHNLFQQLSRRQENPAAAHRPFDADREGSVMGEAAGALILEDLEHAKRRGATIHGELVSFACGFDKARDGVAMAKVIRQALQRAGARADEVDHVNAQGLATAASDVWEAKAINDVFGPKTPVWAMKGNFGTSGAAAGVIEAIGSVLALARKQLPPTINCERVDPACPVHVHTDGVRPVTRPFAVSLNFTDKGQVGVAVLRQWEGS